jgi:hypothetical protein
VADALTRIGFTATIEPTPGHPIVVGEWRKAGPDAPTLLVYGHYDVQPAEPLELWTSPAFEPTVRDGRIYARGSVDDKGQLYLHIKALEAHLAVRGTLPVNVIVLAEGEEEVGSENLEQFLEREKARLACDAVVISDSTMFAPGIPSILSSLRGMAYLEINVRGANGDLHSGMYGGAVVNPAMALARILASMHDASGRIAIPGFYDDVRPFPDAVLAQTPLWAQAMFFGALLSAIMSTASGTLLAPSLTLAENIIREIRPMNDRQFLLTIRIVVVCFAIAVTAFALLSQGMSIYEMVGNSYKVPLVGAFVPLVMGLYWKRATTQGALMSVIGGLGSWLLMEIFGAESIWPPQLVGLLVAFAGMIIGSLAPQRLGKAGATA